MPPQEQSLPSGDPREYEAQAGIAARTPIVVRLAARILAVLVALALLLGWLYLLSGVVEVTLDYPIRRAGESEMYPARGTTAFWWNCLMQTSKAACFSYLFGGIPLIGLICIYLCVGFAVRRWTARIAIALLIAGAPFIYGYLHIRLYNKAWFKLDAVWDIFGNYVSG